MGQCACCTVGSIFRATLLVVYFDIDMLLHIHVKLAPQEYNVIKVID